MQEKKTVLWIDGCVRGPACSRSYALAQEAVQILQEDSRITVSYLNLMALGLTPLYGEAFWERQKKEEAKRWEDPAFDLAHSFAAADGLLFAAPYWEFSFPALVKCYLEHISVADITFCYTPQGIQGLCKARELLFCTTRGGIATGAARELEQGGRYLHALCQMYGIAEMEMVAAEGLDMEGVDVEGKMAAAKQEARQAAWQMRQRLFAAEETKKAVNKL